ncbi:PEP-CTERM sorting domain-containing protein [Luteolibacter luteus]|uniref:PEP-CTERM sorting domain-containing protein n=1 Tax=Luteolibacter luteus TaxID=2728835 RepID=A0A858RPQ9_9BACT|nr:PEP-CTERM sorting domain-containing protein [Luteolibacter luteus]QJE99017.1 PEP-CTERM sorting domain-containing protein [Luteolibacter luteus]
MLRPLLATLGLAATALTADAAQIIFTITGTVVSSTVDGYATNDQITLTFIANDEVPTVFDDIGVLEWYEENVNEPEVFSSVTFSGASGTWTRPTNVNSSPESQISIFDNTNDDLVLAAFADITDDPDARNGLSIGSEPVKGIVFQSRVLNSPFSLLSEDPVNIGDYFASYLGEYQLTDPGSPSYIEMINGESITFNATDLVIAQVPEPSAPILALGAAGAGLLRRRRK